MFIDQLKEVVSCFRLQYHPDVNKEEGAEEKFKEIANAYEVSFHERQNCSFQRNMEIGIFSCEGEKNVIDVPRL